MKHLSLFFFLILPVWVIGQTDLSTSANQLLKAFETKTNSVGTAAGISIDGVLEWSGLGGYLNREDKVPFEASTRTRIASIAKPMTAISILQLFEDQKLGLDDLVCTYLEDCPQAWEKITILQLLSHTSGMEAYANSKEVESKIQYKNLKEAIAVFKDRALTFEPGSNFQYTTYGYVVLGRIIEVVSGLSYEAYMKKNIWEVAGMQDTGIEIFNDVQGHSAVYYKKNEKKIKKGERNNLSNRIPGGGFYSTLDDLLKFGNAVLNHQLISAETFELMTQNQFEEKEGNSYAMGWFLYGQKEQPNSAVGHGGAQTGASTQLMILPGQKIVVVVLSNTSRIWQDVIGFSVELVGVAKGGE